MKKLNRKGFTLIELLAVIIIMAIILVVTVPNIIQSINDARASSLHNLAVSSAGTYDKLFAQDLVATNKILGNIPEKLSSSWQCIGAFKSGTDGNGSDENLAEILGLSVNDVVLGNKSTAPANIPDENKIKIDATTKKSSITKDTCSAIRLNNGSAEVILVASNGGRFYVAQYITYAYSKDTAAKQTPAS